MYLTSKLLLHSGEILSSISVYMLTIACGLQSGWTSPASDKIFQTHTVSPWFTNVENFPMTRTVTVFNVGAFMGPMVTYLTLNRFGRRKTHLVSICSQILAALLYLFAINIEMIYVARFLDGMTFTISLALTTFYLGEILSDSFRTIFTALIHPMFQIGALMQFGILPYTSVMTSAMILLVISSLALVFYFFMQESPYYLVYKNRDEDAKKSISALRNNVNIEVEFNKCKKTFSDLVPQKFVLKEALKDRVVVLGLLIVTGLSTIDILLGADLIAQYIYYILNSVDSSLPIEAISMVLNVTPMLSFLITVPLIYKLGRRLFYIIFLLINLVCISIYFSYIFLKIHNVDVLYWSCVPAICVVIFKTSSKVCITPLSAIYASELSPLYSKTFAQMFYIFFICVVKIGFNEASVAIVQHVGLIFLIGSIVVNNFLSIFFVFLLPETNGIALYEIHEKMRAKNGM